VADSPEPQLRDAIRALASALAELGAPHMIIGGIAVILRGAVRQTNDIDATVWAEGVDLDALLSGLGRHGIAGRIDDAAQFARDHQVFLLRHVPTGTPMELSLAWLPFEATALQRAESLDVEGLRVPVALAEDLVVYKAVAWRDRDRADIERLLILHGDEIDLAYVRRMVAEFAALLGEPERASDFERLIERARRKQEP
jgi:predicted nucleotidyltransferase